MRAWPRALPWALVGGGTFLVLGVLVFLSWLTFVAWGDCWGDFDDPNPSLCTETQDNIQFGLFAVLVFWAVLFTVPGLACLVVAAVFFYLDVIRPRRSAHGGMTDA